MSLNAALAIGALALALIHPYRDAGRRADRLLRAQQRWADEADRR